MQNLAILFVVFLVFGIIVYFLVYPCIILIKFIYKRIIKKGGEGEMD